MQTVMVTDHAELVSVTLCFSMISSDFRHKCTNHRVKIVQTRSYAWSILSRIRTRNNSVFGHFSRSDILSCIAESTYPLHQIYLGFFISSHRDVDKTSFR